MATVYENLCGNSVDRIEFIFFDSSLSRNFENCQVNVAMVDIKKNQMHVLEMPYKCQLYSNT
jgi:hypothetical protein